MKTPAAPVHLHVSRRERQILDILFARGQATVAEVQTALPDAPGYSAVRALLRILESKGLVRHEEDGPRYVYLPVMPLQTARRSALTHLVRTFFDGSTEQAMAALLDSGSTSLSEAELNRLGKLIADRKKVQR